MLPCPMDLAPWSTSNQYTAMADADPIDVQRLGMMTKSVPLRNAPDSARYRPGKPAASPRQPADLDRPGRVTPARWMPRREHRGRPALYRTRPDENLSVGTSPPNGSTSTRAPLERRRDRRSGGRRARVPRRRADDVTRGCVRCARDPSAGDVSTRTRGAEITRQETRAGSYPPPRVHVGMRTRSAVNWTSHRRRYSPPKECAR